MSLLQPDRHHRFLAQGFVHLPELLAPQRANDLRDHLRELSGPPAQLAAGIPFKWGRPDGVTLEPALWDLLFGPALLRAIRDTLGCEGIGYTEGPVRLPRRG